MVAVHGLDIGIHADMTVFSSFSALVYNDERVGVGAIKPLFVVRHSGLGRIRAAPDMAYTTQLTPKRSMNRNHCNAGGTNHEPTRLESAYSV